MRLMVVVLVIMVSMVLPCMVSAATWYIKADGTGDAPTIQAGIDAAAPGDDVLVAAGVYTWTNQSASGDFMIGMRSGVWLHSESGPEITVIDAEDQGTAIVCWEVDNLATIEGFTITGGHGMGGPVYYGGGVFCYSSSLTIRGNVIENNVADHDGGGISCGANSSVRIVDNEILNNSAWPGNGGGINCWACSPSLRIEDNVIRGNYAMFGGGIACSATSPVIEGNLIVGNLANDGGGIQCESSSPTIAGNVIALNEGRNNGGGIRCHTSSPNIIASTLVGNIGPGAGMHNCCSSSPTLDRTIIAFSTGVAIYCQSSTGGSAALSCCDVYGNSGGDWIGCIAGQSGINGNFSGDPLFCDRLVGDYRLDPASPCAPDNSPGDCGLIGALPVCLPELSAAVDMDPNTLNLKSKGKWVTCYIELPEESDAGGIDVNTVVLNDAIPAEMSPINVGDHDSDGIPDLMVKFSRSELIALIPGNDGPILWLAEKGGEVPPIEHGAEFEVMVSGELTDGTPFSGTDVIRVMHPGGGKKGRTVDETFPVKVYPTAVRETARISYELATDGPVSLRVFDAAGRLVRTLETGHKVLGTHTVTWDRRADDGQIVGSGVYFVRLEQRGKVAVQKLLIVD